MGFDFVDNLTSVSKKMVRFIHDRPEQECFTEINSYPQVQKACNNGMNRFLQ